MSSLKKYKFLIKPAFFICNLLFSTWLVFRIEKISPSDFGRYRDWFDVPKKEPVGVSRQRDIKKLCNDYKAGLLDSIQLQERIDKIIKPAN